MAKLTNEELQQRLEKFEAWTLDEEANKLVAGFEFEDFNQAVEFANSIAELANEIGHHPDILIHDFKYVTIFTSTHDEEGITEKDFELVENIEKELVSVQ
jgi:4a-hydroxytetrahydrobiopterin dehydratase